MKYKHGSVFGAWQFAVSVQGICFASGKFAPLAQHLQLSDSQRHSSYCHLTTLAAPSWQLRAAPESARSPRIQEMMAVLSLGAVLTEASSFLLPCTARLFSRRRRLQICPASTLRSEAGCHQSPAQNIVGTWGGQHRALPLNMTKRQSVSGIVQVVSCARPSSFRQLAATDSAFAALRADGHVIAWGDSKGQAGQSLSWLLGKNTASCAL